MTAPPNPFLARTAPSPTPWDLEKHQQWEAARALGRWPFALRRVRARLAGGDWRSPVFFLVIITMLPALSTVFSEGLAAFDPRDLLRLIEVAPWYIPVFLGLFALAFFGEALMRWQLYESFWKKHSGPPYVLSHLAAAGTVTAALLNVRLVGQQTDRILRNDGQGWRTLYVDEYGDSLIHLVMHDEQHVLAMRGSYLICVDGEGRRSYLETDMEGGYIIPMPPDAYLLAGTPHSLWYNPDSGDLQRLEVQTRCVPVTHQGRAYLIDDAQQVVVIGGRDSVASIPGPTGALAEAIAVAADGTIFIAERVGSERTRGRVSRYRDGAWQPLRAPFSDPVSDLVWADDSLLTISAAGLHRYRPVEDTWSREAELGGGWRFMRLADRLVVADTNSGALRSWRDGAWQPDLLAAVPLTIPELEPASRPPAQSPTPSPY